MITAILDQVFRREGGRVLAGLIRFTGDFDLAEDALQDAFARALVAWPRDGLPDNPGAWLTTAARRRAIRSRPAPQDASTAAICRICPRCRKTRTRNPDRSRRPGSKMTGSDCSSPAATPRSPSPPKWHWRSGRSAVSPRATSPAHLSSPRQQPRSGLVRARTEDPRRGDSLRSPAEGRPARAPRGGSCLRLPDLQRGPHGHRGPVAWSALICVREATATGPAGRGALPDEPEARGLLALVLLTDARRPARIARAVDSCRSRTRIGRSGIARRSHEGTAILATRAAVSSRRALPDSGRGRGAPRSALAGSDRLAPDRGPLRVRCCGTRRRRSWS